MASIGTYGTMLRADVVRPNQYISPSPSLIKCLIVFLTHPVTSVCAIAGTQVINFMLNSDQENYYGGVTITPDEWKAVEALNHVLEVSFSPLITSVVLLNSP